MMKSSELIKLIEKGAKNKIKVLYLSGKGLNSLPLEIGHLSELRTLHLSGNNFHDLPIEIGKLKNLRYLHLENNKLSTLPAEIGRLTELKWVYLKKNQITKIPYELSNLKKLKWLDLSDNPIQIPPEILEKQKEPHKILNYYLEHHAPAVDKKPLNEAKMLLVGQGSVGKTSIMNRIIENRFDPQETKTQGIDIKRWKLHVNETKIQLNIWDFGGQEIMHATHQFFLTKRSLYLLILDSRLDEQENRVEYWLKIIESFSDNSPVIIACNKTDEQRIDLDWLGLQKKYPAIKGYAKQISCKTGKGIDSLLEIIKREVCKLEHINDELLTSWFAVKNKLEIAKVDYLSYTEYKQMCEHENITTDISQRTLLGFLHDLGIVLHFFDHPLLEDTNVLNPEWVTKGVYKILNSNILFQNKGVLNTEDLTFILDPELYPLEKHMFIIDMMRKFELCFDFEGYANRRFLIPDLLPKEEPETGEWNDSIAFQYSYNILPSSIISRFIVRMHAYISQNTYWRTGVVLVSESAKNKALIKADIEEKKILIFIKGEAESKRRFLEIIRSDFRKIHATIPRLFVYEKVPIPNHQDIIVDYKHLLNLEELGKETFVPEGLRLEVNVKMLLDGIDSEDIRNGKWQQKNIDVTKTSIQEPEDANIVASGNKKTPWISGSFYLFVFIVVMATLMFPLFFTNVNPVWYIPTSLLAGLLSITLIGVFQLRQDHNLSEENLVKLVIEFYKRLKLLMNKDSDEDVKDSNQL